MREIGSNSKYSMDTWEFVYSQGIGWRTVDEKLLRGNIKGNGGSG